MSARLVDLADDGIAPSLYELAAMTVERLVAKGVDQGFAERAVVSLVQCSIIAGKVDGMCEARERMAGVKVTI